MNGTIRSRAARILVFASGTPTGGGSGFANLVEALKKGEVHYEIIGVVSNHANGGVHGHSARLGVPFFHFAGPYNADGYQSLATATGANLFVLSGWLKRVRGLDPLTRFNSQTVINIHPGPLPRFGGQGMYGHHVHLAVLNAYRNGEITHSAVTMHFVTDEYDKGPIFAEIPIEILPEDSTEGLAARVNIVEHSVQPRFTELVANGFISWNGSDPTTLRKPRINIISPPAAPACA